MKKLITVILVALVPFVTMAQKRSKKEKNTKSEIKISAVNFMVIRGMSVSEGGGISKEEIMAEMSDSEEGALMRQKIREKGLRISFDFGTQVTSEMKDLRMKARTLHSMTDAVNVLAKYGWQFSNSDILSDENVTYYYYYMTR